MQQIDFFDIYESSDEDGVEEFNSYKKGLFGELIVQANLTKLGFDVAHVLGDNSKKDLIIDYNNISVGVQVKTSTLRFPRNIWKYDFRRKNISRTSYGNKLGRWKKYNSFDIPIFACVSYELEKILYFKNNDSPEDVYYRLRQEDFNKSQQNNENLKNILDEIVKERA